jgi:hypothetical protein
VSFEAEVLLGRFRARGSRLFLPTVFLGVAAFLATFITGKLSEQWMWITAYVLCGALAFFGFLVPLLRYLSSWTDVTTSRVVQRSGLFGQNYRSVSMANIQRVELGAGSVVTLFVSGEEALELRGLPKAKVLAQEISRLCAPGRVL